MNYRKCLAALGTLVLIPSLAGCGSSSEEQAPDSTARDSTASTEPATSVPSEVASPVTTAFRNKIAEIPGTIEAENFDDGESNVAYADQEEKNLGAEDYRGPTQVDIEQRDDASGGYGVGWTRKGEWLVYTVSVKAAGVYRLEIPVACDKQGGTFHLEFDGKDVTGPIEIPDTGGWTTLQTISTAGLQLEAGVQTMKLVMDTVGKVGSTGDIDCLIFTAASE